MLLFAVALVAAGCSDSKSSTAASSGATTVKVSVDNKTSFPATFTSYFPNEVTVHAGDTVSFTSVFTGEPHSVTLGTLVTEGLNADDPHASDENFDSSTIPQLKAIPDMLPQGPGDANQISAQPCYVQTGNPPDGDGSTPCPDHSATPPEFTGNEALFNSGFLADGATYDVKLSSNIKPGTYRYFCTLHREAMQGKITVVASGDKTPTATENQSAADTQLQKAVAAIQPGVDSAKTAPPDQAVAGVVSETEQDAAGDVFGPTTADIKVNDSVTWTIIGAHTISFNAPQDAKTIVSKAADGSVHVNTNLGPPAGGGVQQPQPPSDESSSTTESPSTTAGGPPTPTLVDGGSFNGTGFYSTGFYLSFPPALNSYKIKFTKAGTYSYVCLVHPGMEGTVKVS